MLACRLSLARLRAGRGDLWMSGDDGGMGKNDSSDDHLDSVGSVTCTRLFVPPLLGSPVLESVEKLDSTVEMHQIDRFSLSDAA